VAADLHGGSDQRQALLCGWGHVWEFWAYQGTFQVWGSARDRVDGYGNAVSPQVGWWISNRLRAVLHNEEVAA
jgi:hypothetical protein